MEQWQLRTEALAFADDLSTLLNGTVCDGIRIGAFLDTRTSIAVVGYGVSERDTTGQAVPLTLGKKPTAYLGMSFRLEADDTEGKHLMVRSSYFSISSDADQEHELLHWDYERYKADGYPEAHVQVYGRSESWDQLAAGCGRQGDPLDSLHIPVGGRRNRPTLEDVVEFLVVERITPARENWKTAVKAGRQQFFEKQLRAAIRRNKEIARDALGIGPVE